MKFENHAEKEFWERAVVAVLSAGAVHRIAVTQADGAVEDRRWRMADIKPKAKAA